MNRQLVRIALLSAVFILHAHLCLWAQPAAIGSWREHLPYHRGLQVAVADDRVYCVTSDGFFAYQRSDGQLLRLSRISGLSDFGVSKIAYCPAVKALVAVYANTNIDLIYDDGRIVNMSDIKRKNIPGNKVVNSIHIRGDRAYLACGFGIVALNLSRREVTDTYAITSGASPDILSVASDDTALFAACDDGVYTAELNSPLISNFTGWSKILADTGSVGDFQEAVAFGGVLIVKYRRSNGDQLLAWNGLDWNTGLPSGLQTFNTRYSMRSDANHLCVTEEFGFTVYDKWFNLIRSVGTALLGQPFLRDGMLDTGGQIWLADNLKGMVLVNQAGTSWEKIAPRGPFSSRNAAMQVVDGTLWTLHGPRNRNWSNAYRYDGFSRWNGTDWITYDGYAAQTPFFQARNFFDNMSLVVDPSDKEHLFIGSAGAGMMEFRNGDTIRFHDTINSPIQAQVGNPTQYKVHGIALDNDRNLWVTNSGTPAVIKILRTNGTWKTFSLAGAVNSSANTGDMVLDASGAAWVVLFGNVGGKEGLLYYDAKGTIDNVSDDSYKVIDFASNRVRCLARDRDGTIWVGTDVGIYVFYPPSLTPQQILIRQNNTNQYLLAGEAVTAIAVDAANRKWIGTETGGLYLFSADGQEQIRHFTVAGSPLFSDNITSLAVDGRSGEVYIGTEKGLMSYRSDAIEPDPEVLGCKDLLVYPNPVTQAYTGPIAIRGLVPNGSVRITDIAGGLVYQTEAQGTQAVWNGQDLNGNPVASGVYMVMASDEAGEFGCFTKVLITR